MEMENSGKHIAVLAFPFGTHASPLLSLVRRISAQVADAVFSFFSTERSNRSLFSENGGFDDIKIYNVEDGLPEGFRFSGNPQESMGWFLEVMPGNFKGAMEAAVAETGREFTCLVTDAFFWFAADMAEEMHVPWIALWTAGPHSLLVHVETETIRQKVGINGPADIPIDFLPGFSGIRAADIPEGVVSGDLESAFSTMLCRMGKALPRAAAVAINAFEELDSVIVNELKSRFQKFLNIGPFTLISPPPSSDPHDCIRWLDKHKPAEVAYISFGSVASPQPSEITALAQALEESGFPFLWSFRGNPEEKLPKGFLERTKEMGKLVPWAPQSQVLAHFSVGAFVTHCGWNSILESVIGGVPMICRPFFGDQHMNSRIVESIWGIGVGVEGGKLTKDGALKALEVILSSEAGQRMRDEVGVYRRHALKAVQSNGNSTENFKTLLEGENLQYSRAHLQTNI